MADRPLYSHQSVQQSDATVVVDPERRGSPVNEQLFGKFAEHLGRNIDGGMCAQVLVNPTFGPWEFPADDRHPDGGIQPHYEADAIETAVREYCEEWDIPNPNVLFEAYQSGTAFGWFHVGDVRTTPDTSPEGDRAQRVVCDSEGGLAQRTYLPLHRTDSFELSVRLRAAEATTVTVGVYAPDDDPTTADPLAVETIQADREWTTETADLTVAASTVEAADDAAYTLAVTASAGPDLVLDRVTLYPSDHIAKADPEVVEHLREADLPLLRWPGGNFVSGYRWRDGIGPIDERQSRVNPAWGHVEPNLFGTAEFVDFCETVGCEPMICINAGDESPEEAADWVEYCNGSTDTEMGALRAEHGHPEPFDIEYWEIGNELFGQWQVGWTTPSGNADRYRQFREAMLASDPEITVQAVGNRNSPDNSWNDALLEQAGDEPSIITDHILAGGNVHTGTDADELFHGFMAYADQLGEKYRALCDRMADAGIESPRLAITELQLFAHFHENPELDSHSDGLTPETMPTRLTISEPLYLATIVHECIRIGEFVQMLTHSATVNHGGGLQKHRERVWPDPVHHGHVLLSDLADGTPLGVDVQCDTISTTSSFGDIRAVDDVPAIDAMAVEHDDELVVTLVNRRSDDSAVDLTVDMSSLDVTETATVSSLSGDEMYRENTYETPNRITPDTEHVGITDGQCEVKLSPYALVRVSVPLR